MEDPPPPPPGATVAEEAEPVARRLSDAVELGDVELGSHHFVGLLHGSEDVPLSPAGAEMAGDGGADEMFTRDEFAVWRSICRLTGTALVSDAILSDKLAFYLANIEGGSLAEAIEHYEFTRAVDPNEEDPNNLERQFRELQRHREAAARGLEVFELPAVPDVPSLDPAPLRSTRQQELFDAIVKKRKSRQKRQASDFNASDSTVFRAQCGAHCVPVLTVRHRLNALHPTATSEAIRAFVGQLIVSPGFDAMQIVLMQLVCKPVQALHQRMRRRSWIKHRPAPVLLTAQPPQGVDTVRLEIPQVPVSPPVGENGVQMVQLHIKNSRPSQHEADNQVVRTYMASPDELAVLFDLLDDATFVSPKARARQLAKCECVCKSWHDRLSGQSRSLYLDVTGFEREEYQRSKQYRSQLRSVGHTRLRYQRQWDRQRQGLKCAPACVSIGFVALCVAVPFSLLAIAENMDARAQRNNDTALNSTQNSTGGVVPFYKNASGFYMVALAALFAILCCVPAVSRIVCLMTQFQMATNRHSSIERAVERDLEDNAELKAITLARTASEDADTHNGDETSRNLAAPQLEDQSEVLLAEAFICNCACALLAAGLCGILVVLKLDDSTTIIPRGLTWVWAFSPLWLGLPSLFVLMAVCTCVCVKEARHMSKPRTRPANNILQWFAQLACLAVFSCFGVWLALPFLQQLDTPTGGGAQSGTSFSVALGLLLFGVGCCACVLNPGSVPSILGISDSDGEGCAIFCCGRLLPWVCCGGCFASSVVIGVYLIAMKLSGHVPTFLVDASYQFSVGIFLIAIPAGLCLCCPFALGILVGVFDFNVPGLCDDG